MFLTRVFRRKPFLRALTWGDLRVSRLATPINMCRSVRVGRSYRMGRSESRYFGRAAEKENFVTAKK